MEMIDILLKHILWYEFLNDLDAKVILTIILSQKACQVEAFLSCIVH